MNASSEEEAALIEGARVIEAEEEERRFISEAGPSNIVDVTNKPEISITRTSCIGTCNYSRVLNALNFYNNDYEKP